MSEDHPVEHDWEEEACEEENGGQEEGAVEDQASVFTEPSFEAGFFPPMKTSKLERVYPTLWSTKAPSVPSLARGELDDSGLDSGHAEATTWSAGSERAR